MAAVVDTSIGGARVARELDRIAELRGYPCLVVSDNGMVSVIRAGIQCEAAIVTSVRKGVRHVDVATAERRVRLLVEDPEAGMMS